MYVGPIVKTYYSVDAYQRDSALMASYGYQAVNIEQLNMTNGLALTLILIFGLLLTPICVGVVVLCFLPLAFSKRWNVSYIQQSAIPMPYVAPYILPQAGQPPVQPPIPVQQPYAAATVPPSDAPTVSSPPGYLTAPPQQRVPFGTRMLEGLASIKQQWSTWKGWQKALSIAGLALVIAVPTAGIISIVTLLRPTPQTALAGRTPSSGVPVATSTATAVAVATSPSTPLVSAPPPGIWCPVEQGQMPLVSACEIYPSQPQLHTPSQGETVLAGTQVGPQIGSGGASTDTESMTNPWAADVDCATNDNTNSGKVRIIMVAHTVSGDYYSWGDQSCGPPSAPSYGSEYFRKATASVTLSIEPLRSNLTFWTAEFIQL